MPKSLLPPQEALYPVPVILVTSVGTEDKKPNIITLAWCGTVSSKPPLVSISIRPSRYSHNLISQSGEFVINIPNSGLVEKADLCGILSGKSADKFKVCSFNQVPAAKVSAPMIKECPVNIECKVKQTLKLGSHDMFIAEILAIHADKEALGANGKIDFEKAAPFVYNHGEYWTLDKKIGAYGFSNKK